MLRLKSTRRSSGGREELDDSSVPGKVAHSCATLSPLVAGKRQTRPERNLPHQSRRGKSPPDRPAVKGLMTAQGKSARREPQRQAPSSGKKRTPPALPRPPPST